MKEMTFLEVLIYDYIKSKLEDTSYYIGSFHSNVISWHIRLHLRNEHNIEITSQKVNYVCSKLIKRGLIERDKNPVVSENYGIQYLLKK